METNAAMEKYKCGWTMEMCTETETSVPAPFTVHLPR